MTKHSIIGTAGHVDHGKTLLIKALTGIDTDRLKEEKKRGITIELGFAYLDLPDGTKAGIIDVPGHEKFVKNMLAGAGGMDLVLLVVAADEGFMPQTREHLGILSLLDIRQGIIVITKTDMVEEDWLAMVQEDVRAQVAGTFLEEAPMLCVSAYTGQGIPELREEIFRQLSVVRRKNTDLPFRIPVDRVFSVEGFGTVITGTLVEGVIHEGDEVTIYPKGLTSRVRRVQVHGETVPQADAGQRVAINLAGLKRTDLERGDDLAAVDSMASSYMLDAKLRILPDCQRVIENNSRLHFYYGARDVLGKVVLLDRDKLSAGEEGFAQFRFTQPVALKNGDRFVVRFYSPLETVGGGIVLNPVAQKHKRFDEKALEGLAVLEQGSPKERISQEILALSPWLPSAEEVKKRLPADRLDFAAALKGLLQEGEVFPLLDRGLIHGKYLEELGEKAKELMEAYHKDNPLEPGMPIEEFRGKLLPGRDPALADETTALLAGKGILRLEQRVVSLPHFQVVYSTGHQKLAEELEQIYRDAGFEPPSLDEMQERFAKDRNAFKQVLKAMVQEGKLLSITPQLYFYRESYEEAYQRLLSFFDSNDTIQLPQFRDLLGTSRKYAVALLEYWDRKAITKKVGDERKLLRR